MGKRGKTVVAHGERKDFRPIRLGQGGVYPGRSVLIAGRTGTLQSSSFTHRLVSLSRP
jgi:hypothetical protein